MDLTIVDIARMAGVGVSTVSRVINEHPDVKAATREKIKKIIEENNYVPNSSARVLKQTITNNIGILIRGMFNPFFAGILNTISMKIESSGYSTIVHYHNDMDDLATLMGFIKEKRLQGVVCLGGDFINVTETSFNNLDASIVMVNVDFNEKRNYDNFSSVSISNEKAGYEAVSYLIQKGHKNIAVVLGDRTSSSVSGLRFEGYKRALHEHDITLHEDYIVDGSYETAVAYSDAKKLLETNKDITAVFAVSDIMAIGVAKAIADIGLKVGQDISLIGFDGLDIARYYSPDIATMKQPCDELCDESVELLINLLKEKTANKHIRLEARLIDGESVSSKN